MGKICCFQGGPVSGPLLRADPGDGAFCFQRGRVSRPHFWGRCPCSAPVPAAASRSKPGSQGKPVKLMGLRNSSALTNLGQRTPMSIIERGGPFQTPPRSITAFLMGSHFVLPYSAPAPGSWLGKSVNVEGFGKFINVDEFEDMRQRCRVYRQMGRSGPGSDRHRLACTSCVCCTSCTSCTSCVSTAKTAARPGASAPDPDEGAQVGRCMSIALFKYVSAVVFLVHLLKRSASACRFGTGQGHPKVQTFGHSSYPAKTTLASDLAHSRRSGPGLALIAAARPVLLVYVVPLVLHVLLVYQTPKTAPGQLHRARSRAAEAPGRAALPRTKCPF